MAAIFLLGIIILLAQAALSFQQGHCNLQSESENGYALNGKTFKSLPAKTLPDCFTACGGNSSCMSINFHTQKEECELNSQTKETRPQLYKKQKDSVYMTNVFGRIPESLLGMQEKPANSCLQILRSGESVGTGDHYWIDPSSTGTPIRVYCDMTTDGGGWTVIKRMVLTSSTPPAKITTKPPYYTILSKYADNIYIPGQRMNEIHTNVGFNQIHFYCRKISVGRTVSIITKNNTAGQQVVRYFTDDTWATKNYPDACGSFDRMLGDDAKVSQTCEKWGRLRSGTWEVNKWGYYDAYSAFRISAMAFTSSKRMYEFGGYRLSTISCDDGQAAVKPNAAGDIFQISVR